MKIDESSITSVVLSLGEDATKHWSGLGRKAPLACGHTRVLEIIDGKTIEILSGTNKGRVWLDWKGREIKVGDAIECFHCTKTAIKERLAARPAEKAERFECQSAVYAAHPDTKWHNCGPVHRHGEKVYMIGYLGQHEWLAINVDDIREIHNDPGWEGTEYGWAWVPEETIQYALRYGPVGPGLEPPERLGKPITLDMRLFADQDKLKAYLGPDDPLTPKGNV